MQCCIDAAFECLYICEKNNETESYSTHHLFALYVAGHHGCAILWKDGQCDLPRLQARYEVNRKQLINYKNSFKMKQKITFSVQVLSILIVFLSVFISCLVRDRSREQSTIRKAQVMQIERKEINSSSIVFFNPFSNGLPATGQYC